MLLMVLGFFCLVAVLMFTVINADDTGVPQFDNNTGYGGGGRGGGDGGVTGGGPGIKLKDLPTLPSAANPPAGAIVGKSLSQFKWVDSQVVPRGAAPEIPNIQQVAPGVFKCILRNGRGWHDGDRNLTTGRYAVKGRAELCCLGGNTPYRAGETWLIGSTIMFDKNFVPSSGYCNSHQPVLHQSYISWDLKGDTMVGTLNVFERGLGSSSRAVRTVQVKRGQWVTLVLKVTFGTNGYYGLSVNGDDFKGFNCDTSIGHIHGSQVGKVSSFGGTWGLYMIMNGAPRDCVVYHAMPFIKKLK